MELKMVLNVCKVLVGATAVVIGANGTIKRKERMEEAKKAKQELADAIEEAKSYEDPNYTEQDIMNDNAIMHAQYITAVFKFVLVPYFSLVGGLLLLINAYFNITRG